MIRAVKMLIRHLHGMGLDGWGNRPEEWHFSEGSKLKKEQQCEGLGKRVPGRRSQYKGPEANELGEKAGASVAGGPRARGREGSR